MKRRAVVTSAAAVLVLLLAVLAAARLFVPPLANPGLGFAAKVLCSSIFVGGVTHEQARADLPDEPIARLIRTNVDVEAARVSATVPLVARRVAVHRPGLGCTLVPPDGSPVALPAALPDAAHGARADRGGAIVARDTVAVPDAMLESYADAFDAARLEAALVRAFAEPDGRATRRTRALVILHRGRLVAERYADGYSADTRFAGWSMAKSVTSALVGILVGEGRIDLAGNVDRPEWRAADDVRGRITVHELLRMSSGLAFDESYTPTGEATRMLFASGDVAAFAASSPLTHEPGSTWSYSSATTNLLSWHIRQAFTGDDAAYLAFPHRALFDRIGMHSAVFEPDAAGTLVGSSFLYATARDWARFGQLYLQDGVWQGERVLPAGWVSYSATPAPAAPLGRYGAHWWLNAGDARQPARRPWPRLPADIFFASGFQGQYVAVLPSHALVVVRLGATARDGAWRLDEFLEALLAALPQ